MFFVMWLSWPTIERENGPKIVQFEEGNANDDIRLTIKTDDDEATIAVKKGGTRKILESDSLDEFTRAIRENVSKVRANDEDK
jgi:hypothetical protein